VAKDFPRLPDRIFMRQVILPRLAARAPARVVSFGCRPYSLDIHEDLDAAGIEVWTADIDPAAAEWGMPGRHLTGDASRLETLPGLPPVDAIICNGVLGWGVDAEDDVRRALRGFHAALSPSGLLILGWNTDTLPDPANLPEWKLFAPAFAFHDPARVTFESVTHVYDFLERP